MLRLKISLTIIAACACLPLEAAERPNVVFIVADDLGWNDVGAYSQYASPVTGTSDVIKTPVIDSLARRGMLFTDAHTPMALCAPIRFSLLTGSNPYRNGRAGGSWGLSASSGFSAGIERTGELGKHLTAGDIMRAGGYKTGYVGKTRLGASAYDKDGRELWKAKGKEQKHNLFQSMDFSRSLDDTVNEHGFDESFTMEDGIQGPPYAYFRNGEFEPIDGSNPRRQLFGQAVDAPERARRRQQRNI